MSLKHPFEDGVVLRERTIESTIYEYMNSRVLTAGSSFVSALFSILFHEYYPYL